MMNTFLSCDWGTSSFRLSVINAVSAEVIGQSKSNEGIALVYQQWLEEKQPESERLHFYLEILKRHITNLEGELKTSFSKFPVVISGMASASIGMLELPYKMLPFVTDGSDLSTQLLSATDFFPHYILIVSGARTINDVMRGEELQLVGCGPEQKAGEAIFIFPGTHSKHVLVSEGKAADFKTYMTGEFFELLSKKSVLANSVEKSAGALTDEEMLAFTSGVSESGDNNILHNSFLVRTNQLFNRFSKQENYYYLSGLLIGAELRQLKSDNINSITIVGDEVIASFYKTALKELKTDKPVKEISIGQAVISGHLLMFNKYFKG